MRNTFQDFHPFSSPLHQTAESLVNSSLLLRVRYSPAISRVRLTPPAFAEKLAAPYDLFVNDAFGTAHRAHGSTEGVTKFLSPSVAGFLLQKELDYLEGAVKEPKRPFAAIVGGSKVSSKIGELYVVVLITPGIILQCCCVLDFGVIDREGRMRTYLLLALVVW